MKHFRSVLNRPTGSTASTTSGQTSSPSKQTSTKRG